MTENEKITTLFTTRVRQMILQYNKMKKENEEAMIFTTMDASILIRKDRLEADLEEDCTPLESRGKRVAAVPENMAHAFGKSFYEEKSMADLIRQTAVVVSPTVILPKDLMLLTLIPMLCRRAALLRDVRSTEETVIHKERSVAFL